MAEFTLTAGASMTILPAEPVGQDGEQDDDQDQEAAMPGISIHVVDVSRGVLAAGMEVALQALDGNALDGTLRLVAQGAIAANGLLDHPALAATFAAGRYRAVFQVGDYYRRSGVALPAVSFLDAVTFDFGIDDPAQHYHLPFKCTPWGYSCFRGGA